MTPLGLVLEINEKEFFDRNRIGYESTNLALAKKYRYLRFSHRANVILHIKKLGKKHQKVTSSLNNKTPDMLL